MMKVHFREQYGTKGNEILYVTPADSISDQSSIVRVPLKSDKIIIKEKNGLIRLFQQIFLPHGYPDSVSEDYVEYQIWDTVQAFCSTITGTLTTHAILKGVGVGSDAVNPLSATVTWVLKDGSGHLGKILFAWWKGSELDLDSKKWRLRADVLNDIAMGVEIFVLPLFPDISTYILCATTTMKAIVGVAGGATRSALTQHHAIRGNLADVASKDSAQETCVNLIASFVGLFLLSAIHTPTVLYSIFTIVTFMHMYANLRAVKSVCLRTFNESRLLITLEEYLKSGRMLPPREVNKLERVTIGQTVSLSHRVSIGLSAKHLVDHYKTSHEVENVLTGFDHTDRFIIAETSRMIGIYLHFDARPQDVLKAYFYAVSYLQEEDRSHHMHQQKYWEIQQKWNDFYSLAQSEGWITASHLIFVDEFRLDWRI
ncbi:RUS family member 1 [Phlebotomus papatasi]|uniref:RUS family member 1 n=1 Tax=Phlebotomus papatasi TaxID=29031 RepID=UPI0024837F75|nr:RUS family member 1 [Phlebotomus papatasi]